MKYTSIRPDDRKEGLIFQPEHRKRLEEKTDNSPSQSNAAALEISEKEVEPQIGNEKTGQRQRRESREELKKRGI